MYLLQEFERSGASPEAWNNIKQVHLPKPNKGKRARDGATDAASMRPICILSVWFRIHASARFKSTSVQRWLDTWWPAEAYGGRRCKSIDDALLQIQYHAEQGKYIGAFDYSLAFDMVDPKIALEIFKHLDMPPGWSRLLNGLWTNQHRLVQYDQECSPSCENVTRSLPQGDPWSMAAMTAVLLPPIRSITQTLPGAQTVTFGDDRTVICDTVASCMEATQHWNMWSATLGLKENPNKEQFYHQTARGRAEFIQHNVNPEKITESPKILGSCLKGTTARKPTADEISRVNKAVRAAQRCALLPLPPGQKMPFLAAVAVSKAAFGWHAYVPPRDTFKKFQKAVKLSMWDHKFADVNLSTILRGHAVDIFFRIASNRLVCLYRQCAKRIFVPQQWNQHKRFKNTTLKFADWIGWKGSANWTFQNPFVRKNL